ncbi:MAG: hypothetical protein NTV89_18415, partial [Proteobacteria bacterium]|nr:hypothetical protein [Pseudomonadota bacterium]
MLKKLLFISFIIVSFLSLELFLHKRQGTEKSTIPPLAVCTHKGEIVSKGSFKLSIAPYTIYKNFPNQKYEGGTINSKGFRGDEVL